MPVYANNKHYDVHLAGPDGRVVIVKAGTRADLPVYFHKYTNHGLIAPAQSIATTPSAHQRRRIIDEARKVVQSKVHHTRAQVPHTKPNYQPTLQRAVGLAVGKVVHEDGHRILDQNLRAGGYPISNNIGVGILSYNRPHALQRLITSIRRFTNLQKTTVFISDDASTNEPLAAMLEEIAAAGDIVVLQNEARLGVAGNSNRLLQCLARFRHMILLNDDVEVLRTDWEYVYPRAALATNYKHFIYRQEGVYGAKWGNKHTVNGVPLRVVSEKPHGAVLYADSSCLDQVGYFDESYGLYGFEHVDWSTKIHEKRLQPTGFWDTCDSTIYFKIHSDHSAMADRLECYTIAKQRWQDRVPEYARPSTTVPALTFIVPFRDTDRTNSINTVIQNIRAQRFPNIQIVLIEQDTHSRFNRQTVQPIDYQLVAATTPFNKSLAFNNGVALADHEWLVLHDADTLAPGKYATLIAQELANYDACHLGAKVIYADRLSSEQINQSGVVDINIHLDRVVGYYEGGSVACTKSIYWTVGGFNENFVGYGCEDCDFYYRLSQNCRWQGNRSVDLLHLWHGRTPGWEEAHRVNKQLESQLRALPLLEYLKQQCSQIRHYTTGG